MTEPIPDRWAYTSTLEGTFKRGIYQRINGYWYHGYVANRKQKSFGVFLKFTSMTYRQRDGRLRGYTDAVFLDKILAPYTAAHLTGDTYASLRKLKPIKFRRSKPVKCIT